MMKMEIISSTAQLPTWYTPERYIHLKRASYDVILNELWLRHHANEDIEQGKECKELSLLFNKRFINDSDIPPDDAYNALGLNVKLISSPVLKILAGEVMRDSDDTDNRYVHEIGMCNLFGDGFVTLNLKLATNSEIIDEFTILLDKLRKESNIPEPKREFRSVEKFDAIFQNHVFEYIDLTLWAKANNLKIPPRVFAEAIVNADKTPAFTATEIQNKVQRNAQQILSISYLKQLEVDIKTHRI